MFTPKLYMIPGTGTDWRMYTPQLERFPHIIIPEWLPPLDRKEPLESYARRLAGTIDTSQPFLLGGVSLGGMIAQEMAKELKPLGVILISTCSSSSALPGIWRFTGKLTRMTPNVIIKLLFRLSAFLTLQMSSRRIPHKEVYAKMLKEMPPSLVRWQSGAATEWDLKEPLTMPVSHIHGRRDIVIPLSRVLRPQKVIPDGGHLINVTHAKEVNAFISACMERPYGKSTPYLKQVI